MKMHKNFSLLIMAFLVLGEDELLAQSHEGDGRLAVALTGDSIITRKLSVYREPEFTEMIDLIRNADVAFTNLEVLFHDYEPYPMHQSGGTYMRAAPEIAEELVWAGFDMVSRANNHTSDYGVLGQQLTTKYVEQAGLVHAGSGRSLAAARGARYLESADGRVALISMASTFPDHSRAGRSRDDIPPRPGLSPLRHSTTYMVPRADFDAMRRLAARLGVSGGDIEADAAEGEIFGRRFAVADEAAVITTPHRQDMEEIAAVVDNASRQSEITIVSIHAHESADDRMVPADFIVEFAHAMIDAGADIFVGHGPHVLRGIEFYKGKPILYSLGDFIFQNETLLRLPSENYERYELDENAHIADFNDARYDHDREGFPANPRVWESVISMPVWEGEELVELTLHPISLQHGAPRTVRGRPLLAGPELSRKIIGDLQRVSEPFGTAIAFEDDIGVVEIPR